MSEFRRKLLAAQDAMNTFYNAGNIVCNNDSKIAVDIDVTRAFEIRVKAIVTKQVNWMDCICSVAVEGTSKSLMFLVYKSSILIYYNYETKYGLNTDIDFTMNYDGKGNMSYTDNIAGQLLKTISITPDSGSTYRLFVGCFNNAATYSRKFTGTIYSITAKYI